jgi:hypothetical protein
MEDILVDLSEDAGIGAKGGRDVFALREEADCASEKALKELCVDELVQAGHVGGRRKVPCEFNDK